MFIPIFHLPGYATARGMDLAAAAGLVTLAGTTSLAGRFVAIPAVSRWGAWPVCRAGATVFCGALVLWAVADSPVELAGFAVVFGLGHGAYVGLAGAVVAQLYGTDAVGLRLGLLYAAAALGGLIGPADRRLGAGPFRHPVRHGRCRSRPGAIACALLAAVRPARSAPRTAASRP